MYVLLIGRKSLIIIFLLIIFVVVMLLGIGIKKQALPAFNLFADTPTVVLDPGHGGVDKGTSSGELIEKEINLDIVQKLAEYISNNGIAVGMTRASDMDLGGKLKKGRHRKDLQKRVEELNRGQIGVSIHVNSGGSNKEGAVIFYGRENEQAKYLAELVLGEISKVQVLDHDYVVPRSNLYILKNTEIPVILIEVGFITNANDRSKLTNSEWRQQMAEAIGTGVIKYLSTSY